MRAGLALVVALVTAVAACGSNGADGPGGSGAVVHVSAASSLTDAFTDAAASFPGGRIELNFGASSALVEQIKGGAPADVLATADDTTMTRAIDAGLVAGRPAIFARNRLTVIVPPDNPAHISQLADVARPGVTLLLCADQVPCGRYAAEAFRKAGLTVTAASKEDNVRAVVSKVGLGEADAGVVYVTDARAAGAAVTAIDIPDDINVVAGYPAAALAEAANGAGARAFLEYLRGPAAQASLARRGFLPP